MKTSTHWMVSIVLAMTTWLFVSFLDVVPAEVAPNCRPELKQFQATLTSMQSLYGLGFAFSGCEYRSVPMTRWVCMGSSLAALACGALMGQVLTRRFGRAARSTVEAGPHGRLSARTGDQRPDISLDTPESAGDSL